MPSGPVEVVTASDLAGERRRAPVVLISGNFRAEIAQQARRLGVTELVYEPAISELGRALQRIFQHH